MSHLKNSHPGAGPLGLTRRTMLAGTAAGLGVSAFGNAVFAQSAVDWKKYAGATIEVNLTRSPRSENLMNHQKEFEALTGIKVNAEATPEQQQRQKVTIELSSGRPSFDVIHLSYHVQKRQFEKAGWLADLSGYMKDGKLTASTLTESDFSSAGLAYAKDSAGKMLSLPFSVDYWMIYWNKELFAKKNLAYPTTFDEMVKVSEALTDPAAGTFGIVARGLKNANVPVWSNFLLGYGGEFIDKAGNLVTDSPEAIEGARLYQRLLTKSAPTGVTGFNWSESQSAFLQGKVGMWLDGTGFAAPMEDPDKSRVVGKVGYGIVPKGPKAQAAATFGDGIGVTAQSKNKEAAYLYCQWAVSREQGTRLIQAGGGAPFRDSIVNDPEVQKGIKLPPEWTKAVIDSSKISKLGLPVIVPITEFRDAIGIALSNALAGADVAVEMKKATEAFKPILERSEKA